MSKSNKISWDNVFDYATEDISMYLWALKSWTDSPDGYEQDYLLLQILNSRARSRFAISLMKEDMPSEYHRNRDKLNEMWQTGEKVLFDFVENHHKDIEKIILEEFTERLSQLEQDLNQIKKIAQDGDLMEDPEWVQDDLKETAHEFLLQFQSMANSNGEIQSELFLKSINSEKFTDKFKQINGLFKGYFGYFNPVADLLVAFSEREYDSEQWWLARYPEFEDIVEDEVPAMLLEILRPIFQKEKQESDRECPQSDNAIAYAFGELAISENKSFKDHILGCHFCYDLVQDTQMAEIEFKESEDKLVKMTSALAKAVNEPKTKNFPGAIKRVIEMFEKIRDFLTVPKMISAFAVACLAIFIINNSVLDLNKSKIGVDLTVLGKVLDETQVRGGSPIYSEVVLDRNSSLKSGDSFQIRTTINQDGFYYLVLQDSSRVITKLGFGKAASGVTIIMPGVDQWYQLDKNQGIESLILIAVENEIPDFDDKLKEIKSIEIDKIKNIFHTATVKSFYIKHE